MQSTFNFKKFFDKQGKLRAVRDEIVIRDGLLPAVIAGTTLRVGSGSYEKYAEKKWNQDIKTKKRYTAQSPTTTTRAKSYFAFLGTLRR